MLSGRQITCKELIRSRTNNLFIMVGGNKAPEGSVKALKKNIWFPACLPWAKNTHKIFFQWVLSKYRLHQMIVQSQNNLENALEMKRRSL
jgi:hypothetical protein